jgi:hypothetical protein
MKFIALGELFGRDARGSKTMRRRRRRSDHIPAKARRRSLVLERLEDRTLPSNLPMPTVTGQQDLIDAANATLVHSFPTKDDFGADVQRSTPSIVVDPLNSQKLAAVWLVNNLDILDGVPAKIFGVMMEGAFSIDGGTSWHAMPWLTKPIDPFQATFLGHDPRNELIRDPNISVTQPQQFYQSYTQELDPSIGFDRLENFYIVSVQASNTTAPGSIVSRTASGAVVLQKFNFSGAAPTRVALADTLDPTKKVETKVLYQWIGQDPAIGTTLAVDDNMAKFVDMKTGAVQTDPQVNATTGQGPIYVAWYTNNDQPFSMVLPKDPFFNNNSIKVIASADGGNSFTGQVYANDGTIDPFGIGTGHNAGAERDLVPQLVVSQGTAVPAAGGVARITGGQLNIVWHNSDPAIATPIPSSVNNVEFNSIKDGGVAAVIKGSLNGDHPLPGEPSAIADATSSAGTNNSQTTTFVTTIAKGTLSSLRSTFDKLDVNISMLDPHLNDVMITLTHGSTTVQLVQNNIDAKGTTHMGVGLTDNGGNNGLGVRTFKDSTGNIIDLQPIGTVFDDDVPRLINDQNTKAPYASLERPEGAFFGDTLSRFFPGGSASAASLEGTWILRITDFRNDGGMTAPKQFLVDWSLDFTGGMNLTGQPKLNGLPAPPVKGTTTPITPNALPPAGDPIAVVPPIATTFQQPVGATPVIASDNTLGAFSPFQGRLYIAYTGIDYGAAIDSTTLGTGIYLVASDDGGKTWNAVGRERVNDDSPSDGFSEGDRPHFEPQVAVDQQTGSVVLSFYDERYDASKLRPSTFIAASNDGGASFAPETFLNTPVTAIDAIKGGNSAPITLEPIPGNSKVEPVIGFGPHQGLAVAGGHIVALWSGNQYEKNTFASVNGSRLDIFSGTATIPGGPRVINGDMGPVDRTLLAGSTAYDNTFAAEGSSANAGARQLNGIVITFDRPVLISRFTTHQVQIVYRDQFGHATDISNRVSSIVPIDAGPYGPAHVGFDQLGIQVLATRFLVNIDHIALPGTYSYSIGPNIADSIRTEDRFNNLSAGNPMDQNANGTTGEDPQDRFFAPNPKNPTVGGVGFQAPYHQDTLPLIVPGPHVVDSFVANGTTASDTSNLVVGSTVSFIDVVFDRDMNPFGPAKILRIFTPTGALGTPITVIPDSNPGVARLINGVMTSAPDPDPTHPRTYKIAFAAQNLSGTYTVTLSSQITSKSGLQLDSNENVGLDVLRNNPSPSPLPPPPPTPVTYLATSAPATGAIPAGTTTVFPLVIPNLGTNNFENQGVSVSVNITDPQDKDLSAFLLAPDGKTKVPLFNHVPVPASWNPNALGANFADTVFDDNANGPISTATEAPFSGAFNPQSPLSVLTGMPSVGVWRLFITNSAPAGVAARSGKLNHWSLTLLKANPGTGLGELVADQATVSFRIFNMDPTNPLSHTTWTAVGPSSNNSGGNSGRVTGLALDPSDPTGNTVYVGGASGGIWKTTNFLTTNPNGPTYVPLTDFGPTFAINIGSIAVFGRNSDPSQSIVFASTGEGDTGTPGVGIIRSMDGGSTWLLEDSTTNVDKSGNPLPITGSAPDGTTRDHKFIGMNSFKVLVDPRPTQANQATVYAAFNGSNGGIYKSIDSGRHWTLISDPKTQGTDPTDMLFAPGDPDTLYAAFRSTTGTGSVSGGIYVSHTGSAFQLLAGARGGDPLIVATESENSFVVGKSPTPNGAFGRIVLAVPALTGNLRQDLIYKQWLYAAVSTQDGHLQGLFVTKDGGQLWTQIQIPERVVIVSGHRVAEVPSNDDTLPNADPLAPTGSTGFAMGNYSISLAVDPTNPEVVYLGGTNDGQQQPQGGIIRVDTTGMFDPYALVPFDNSANDGGQFQFASKGNVKVDLAPDMKSLEGYGVGGATAVNYLNLLKNPNNYFVNNAPILTTGFGDSATFQNDGTDIAKWTGIEDFVSGTTDQHRVISLVDPLTGHARLIFGDDQGVFTAVDRGDGTLISSIGSTPVINGPRSGNLSITQFYSGAAQPSILAADVAGALFYGNAQDDGHPHSDPNILTTGELGWTGPTGDGKGVNTDQTGSGYVYYSNFPCCNGFGEPSSAGGSEPRDFFEAGAPGRAPISKTDGLFEASNTGFQGPDTTNWPYVNAFNFAVNPISQGGTVINPTQQMVISSAVGHIFKTEDGGTTWVRIAGTGDTDDSNAQALAYGAPDPNPNINPLGLLDLFIYAGTAKGNIFVTFQGGGQPGSTKWINISKGLDGSPVGAITTNTVRGSHEAFAVTQNGVYHMLDSSVPGASWVNITGSLFSLTHSLFLNQTQSGPRMLKGTTGLDALAVDWRTSVPTLYVGGDGGVFRSLDLGKTWTFFPDVNDGAAINGGYLPNAKVTKLELVLGNVQAGRIVPLQSTGPDLLVAYTFGRGAFAIRLNKNLHHGPEVAQFIPQFNSAGNAISSVQVNFDKTVDPSTFTPSKVVFKKIKDGITTIIPITFIQLLDDVSIQNPGPLGRMQYRLFFPTQTDVATYIMTIGPDVRDYTGAGMDQDNDVIDSTFRNGQPDDAFTTQFNLPKAAAAVAALPAAATTPAASLPLLVTASNLSGVSTIDVFATGTSTRLFSFAAAPGTDGAELLVNDGKTGAKLGVVRPRDPNLLEEVLAEAAKGSLIPDPLDHKLRVHSTTPSGALLDEFFSDFDSLVGGPLARLRPKQS